jgi:membrane protein implicated in regulation of membrane protease activity
MRTAQERVEALHLRAARLRRRREDAALARLGSACGALLIVLTGLIFGAGRSHTGVSPGAFTGATMLFASAGGYVLVAVIAFAVGAVVTAVLLHRRRADAAENEERQNNESAGGNSR